MPTMPPTHRRGGPATRIEQNRQYDQRRGPARERGYNEAWVRGSRGHKAKHPWCLGCQAVGQMVPVDVTDHVVPGTSGTPAFWDSSRWQSACKWHHDVVKQRLEHMWRAGTIDVEQLWLNSAAAMALTRQLAPPGGG